jgi:hypothetical protein
MQGFAAAAPFRTVIIGLNIFENIAGFSVVNLFLRALQERKKFLI